MDKNTVEFITYEEVVTAIKTIRDYCNERLGCSLCSIRSWCETCTDREPLDWRV